MNKRTLFLIISAVVLTAFNSCGSVPKNIPENITAQELIQNGQSNFEAGNYKAALIWYNTAVERYADWPSIYIEARYETAHLYMKQKKYNLAKPIFEEIRSMYASAALGTYPASFNKLAEIGLAKIEEKTNKNK